MADEKEEKLPLVADGGAKEAPVIDLLRAACWEKPPEAEKTSKRAQKE